MPSASFYLLHVLCFAETHIKRNPNGIKMDREYFWNIWRIWEEEPTRDGARGGHETGGAPAPLVGPPAPLVGPHKAVAAILLPQES